MFTASTNSTYQDLFGLQSDETRDAQCFEFMPRMHSFDFDSELDSNRYVYFDMNKFFMNESPASAALSSLLNSTCPQQQDEANTSQLDESCSSSSTATITHITNQDDLDQIQVNGGLCMNSPSISVTSSSEMNSSASPSSSSSSTSLLSASVTGHNNTNSSLYLLKKSLANKLSLPASASSSSECLSSCCNYGDDEGYVGSLTDSSSASSTARGGPPQPPQPSLVVPGEVSRGAVKGSINNTEPFLFSRYFFEEKSDTESNQMTGSMEEKPQSLMSSPPIVYSNSDEDLTGYEEDETNSEDEEENENEVEEDIELFTIPCLFQEAEKDEEEERVENHQVTREPDSFAERLWFYWSSSCLDDQTDFYSSDEKCCVDCCDETCELCELEKIRSELEQQRESNRLETEDAMKKQDEWRRVVERLQRELATRREYAHEDSIDMNAYLNEIEMNIDYLQHSTESNLDDFDDLLRFTSNRTAFNLRSYHNFLMKSLQNAKAAASKSHVTSGSSIREMFEKMDKIPEFVPPSTSSRQQTVVDEAIPHDQELVVESDLFLDYETSQHETTLYVDEQNCDEMDLNLNDNNATLVEAANYDDNENNNQEDEEYQYYLNEAGGSEFFVDGVYDEELEDQFYIDSLTEEEALSLLRNESELYAMHMAQASKLGLLPNTNGSKSSKSKKNKSSKQKNKTAATASTATSAQPAKSVTESSSIDGAVPAAKKSKKSKKSKKQKKADEEQSQQDQENTVPSASTTDTLSVELQTEKSDEASEELEQAESSGGKQSESNEQDIFETVFTVYDQGEECCDDEVDESQSQQRSHQASECDYYEEISSEFGGFYKTESSVSSMTVSNTMRDSLIQLRMSRRHLSRLIEAHQSPTKSSSPSSKKATNTAAAATVTPQITIKQRSSTAACFNKPCMYMLTDGKCMRSDCRYVHDFKTITCKYWLEGECLKGETCEFLHEHVDGGGKSAATGVAFSFGSVCSSSTTSSSGASSGSKKAKKKKKAAAAAAATAAQAHLHRDDFNLDSEEFPALGGFGSAFPALISTVTEKPPPPVQSVKSIPKSDVQTSSKSTPLSQVVKSTTTTSSKAMNIGKSALVVKGSGGEKSKTLSSSLSSSNTTSTSVSSTQANKPSGKSTPVKK